MQYSRLFVFSSNRSLSALQFGAHCCRTQSSITGKAVPVLSLTSCRWNRWILQSNRWERLNVQKLSLCILTIQFSFLRSVFCKTALLLTFQPLRLSSPTRVLRIQRGTCFDYSTVLCSLLLGAGYNAYCVSGYAVKEMCLRQLDRQECPLLKAPIQVSDIANVLYT